MQKEITGIFFDIGGVLLNIHPERTIQHLNNCTGISKEIIKTAFSHEIHNKYEKGEINNQEFFQSIKRVLPKTDSLCESDFWEAWGMLLGEETSVSPVLRSCSKHIPIWLLSNTNPYHIELGAKRFSFLPLVTGAVFSYDVGYRKPDKDIFRIALNLAGKTPGEVFFIDDDLKNINQARKIGLNSHHFTSVESLKQKMIELGLSFLKDDST